MPPPPDGRGSRVTTGQHHRSRKIPPYGEGRGKQVVGVFRASPRARYYPVLESGYEPCTDAKEVCGTRTIADRRGLYRRQTCYVTAACLEALGLADAAACYELCLLRLFRDEYVTKLADGPRIISDYRRKSPWILRAIERLEDPRGDYLRIHERWLVPWLGFIAKGRWDEAYAVYTEMHGTLEDELLDASPATTRNSTREASS